MQLARAAAKGSGDIGTALARADAVKTNVISEIADKAVKDYFENYNKLGYFYYSNSEQFYRIIKMFEDESIEVMKNFSNQMGPTVSDTVKIYSDLASCDI